MPDTAVPDGSVMTAATWDAVVREQVIVTCTSSTRPTGVEGRVIFQTDTDSYHWYTGSAWKQWLSGWTSFSPSWTNLTIGSGPTESWWYKYDGGDILIKGRTTLGTGGSASGTVSMTVPDSVTAATGAHSLGVAVFNDGSGTDSTGVASCTSGATSIGFFTTAYATINATVPFTWTATDQIWVDGLRIEVA